MAFKNKKRTSRLLAFSAAAIIAALIVLIVSLILGKLQPQQPNPHAPFFVLGDQKIAAGASLNLFFLQKGQNSKELRGEAEKPLLVSRDGKLLLTADNKLSQPLRMAVWVRQFDSTNVRYQPRPGKGDTFAVKPGIINRPVGLPLILRALNKTGYATLYLFASYQDISEKVITDWLSSCPKGGEFCMQLPPHGTAILSRILVFDTPQKDKEGIPLAPENESKKQ